MGISVGNSVGQNEGSIEGTVVGLSVGSLVGLPVGFFVGASIWADDDGVTDGALEGRLVGASNSDDDIILLVSVNCSDRWSWVWSLDKRFAIYDESNTWFKFIRVIDKSHIIQYTHLMFQ